MNEEIIPSNLGIEILETYDPNDFTDNEVEVTKVEIKLGGNDE